METRGPSVFGVAFRIVLREDDGSYSRRTYNTRTDALSRSHGAQTPFWARTLDVPLFQKGLVGLSRSGWKDLVYRVSVVNAKARTVEIKSTVSMPGLLAVAIHGPRNDGQTDEGMRGIEREMSGTY